LFKTPNWAKQSPTAEKWLKRYRVSVLVCNSAFALGFVIYLLFSQR
jgi:hypothetical protein